jgi:hypothetical protein
MRIALGVVVCAVSALAVGASRAPASPQGPPPILAKAIYVVHPDPRECPSPLCGGYWVSLANRSRTRCHDGLFRPRCYVAEAIGARNRLPTSVPGDALAKAVLGSESFGGLGELGILSVTDVWTPVEPLKVTGDFFRLRDTGVRCVRPPCFSIRVGRLNAGAHTILVSALDLGPARSGPARRRAESALASADGLLAGGRITATADGGRLFRASQVYLKSS